MKKLIRRNSSLLSISESVCFIFNAYYTCIDIVFRLLKSSIEQNAVVWSASLQITFGVCFL